MDPHERRPLARVAEPPLLARVLDASLATETERREGLLALRSAEGRRLVEAKRRALEAARAVLDELFLSTVRGIWPATRGDARAEIQERAEDALIDLESLVRSTSFHGLPLLTGEPSMVGIAVDSDATDFVVVPLLDLRADSLGLSGLDLRSGRGAAQALVHVGAAIALVDRARAVIDEDVEPFLAPAR